MGKKRVILSENQFKTFLIKEYMDKNHLMPLWKYFNMSDEEKQEDLIYHGWYLAKDFLDEWVNDHDYEEDEGLSQLGLTYRDYEEIIQLVQDEDRDFLCDEIINGRFQGMKGEFTQMLANHYTYANNGMDTGPSWLHMEYAKMVKNEWLIHFSNNANKISYQGFKHGTEDFDNLAYSYAGETAGKFEGYDFAYTLEGAKHYAFLSRGAWGRVPKYGKEAVIFRASGVKLWHHGDDEEQVIFWGPIAKDIIYLEFDEETSEWYISSTKRDGQVLYKNEDIDEVISWIQNNYDQYRKHLSDYRRHPNYETNYNNY